MLSEIAHYTSIIYSDRTGMKHPMERIVDTGIPSPGLACKNIGNWNGAVLVGP